MSWVRVCGREGYAALGWRARAAVGSVVGADVCFTPMTAEDVAHLGAPSKTVEGLDGGVFQLRSGATRPRPFTGLECRPMLSAEVKP